MLSRSQLHFIHCLVPTSVESKTGQGTPSPPQPGGDQGGTNKPLALDIPALRVQLAGCHILEALRLHRAGKNRWEQGALVLAVPIIHQSATGQEHSLYVGESQNRSTHYGSCAVHAVRKIVSVFHFTDEATEVQNRIPQAHTAGIRSTGLSGVPDCPGGFQNCFWLQRARPSFYIHHGKSGHPKTSHSLRFQTVSQCEDLSTEGVTR